MTSNRDQVLFQIKALVTEYGLKIDPDRWRDLPYLGWMNPDVLSMSMSLYHEVDYILSKKGALDAELAKFASLKKYILKKLSGKPFYFNIMIIKYLVAMKNYDKN